MRLSAEEDSSEGMVFDGTSWITENKYITRLIYPALVSSTCTDELLAYCNVRVRYYDSPETIYMRLLASYSRYDLPTPQTSHAPPFSEGIHDLLHPGLSLQDDKRSACFEERFRVPSYRSMRASEPS